MKESEKYLKILARQYPSERAVITELVNLQAILSLPKGTEHFLSDIHGEYEQFNHVLKNGSGSIRQKIEEVFGSSETEAVKRSLATLIYYPQERLEIIRGKEPDIDDWYSVTLHRLVLMMRRVSSKYTRSHVRKMMPSDFSYLIEELITEKEEISDKRAYYDEIIHTVIRVGAAEPLIITLCNLIQALVIAHLHIIGDIFDRGPGPHIILDTLMKYHSVDIQWGNHDLVWMGAAAGQTACIANVVRLSVHYSNLDVLEEGYGINLTPLVTFAIRRYGGSGNDSILRAVSMIQFKLEGQLIKKYPEFNMQNRLFLDKIDKKNGIVTIDGKEWKLNSVDFPTLDTAAPYKLTDEERDVVQRLKNSFTHCEKLQKQIRFLYANGNLYKVYNGNLLYHGCMPLDVNGNFARVTLFGKKYSGKELYDVLEKWARTGYFAEPQSKEKTKGEDILWYLWTGPWSPVFGKDKMAVFEAMYIDDTSARIETKNTYYNLVEDETVVDRILSEFGLDRTTAHIINGHVPQEVRKGETPVKCGGKLLIIDGGFSAAYHEKTGIAGYTLVSNSRGMRLVVHEKFETTADAIQSEKDIVSDTITVETFPKRKYVGDTETGRAIKSHIGDLEKLLEAYHSGTILVPEISDLAALFRE
ncbi:MAG: fructose-1,6-bisphosphatase [Treponema sp.]|jgi:fructose-1,6-bisphosphatase-3|nr:fructose-1,6-bisphosphatase [Treponema sp.]